MATIKLYDAPVQRLKPDEKGFAAFETAGRRIGPLYNQAAQDYEKIGKLTAETLKQRDWPYNILDLQNSSEAKSGRTGLGFRVKDFGTAAVARGAGGRGVDMSAGANAGRLRPLREMSTGMAGLGRALSQAQDPAQAYRDRLNLEAKLTGRTVGTDWGPGGSFDRIMKPGEWLDQNGNIMPPFLTGAQMDAQTVKDDAAIKAQADDINSQNDSAYGQDFSSTYGLNDPLAQGYGGGGDLVPQSDNIQPGFVPAGSQGIGGAAVPSETSSFGAIGNMIANSALANAITDASPDTGSVGQALGSGGDNPTSDTGAMQ